jgi:predicted TIM-barrel fold metal-dependent hydrolase
MRFRELYESVGATRLIWGSNYPPAKRACTYGQALQFIRDECDFLTAADRDAILGGNFMKAFGAGIRQHA